jgi:phosphoglycolate phosphatase-like HAD superfamily hydrolase
MTFAAQAATGVPTMALVDFDGTLMESTADLVELTRQTLAVWGLRPGAEEMEGLLGLPTAERLRRHGVPSDRVSQAAAHFLEFHAACGYERSRPIPGAAWWLATTPHVTKWIVSASPRSAVLAGLQYHGLADSFTRVLAAPPAATLDKVAALAPYRARLAGTDCWMLGDQRNDLEAAVSIGARFALVRNPRNGDLVPLADRVLTSFEEFFAAPLEDAWTLSL